MKLEHWAYIGIGVTILLLLGTCDGCEEYDEGEMYEYEQSSDGSTYKLSSESFSNDIDVRTYLCRNRFSSSDGLTLSFSNVGNEMSINSRPVSTYIEILSISRYSAVIRAHGPYGIHRFRLSVSGSDGVIEDLNSGDTYYSQ